MSIINQILAWNHWHSHSSASIAGEKEHLAKSKAWISILSKSVHISLLSYCSWKKKKKEKKEKKKKITLCRLKCHIGKKFWRDTYICKVKNHRNLRKQTIVFQCFLYVFALCISGNKFATAVRKPFSDFAVNIVLSSNCNLI